jgi:hypothetical protein
MNHSAQFAEFWWLGAFNASARARRYVSILLLAFVAAIGAAPIASYSPSAATMCPCCKGKVCICHRHGSATHMGGGAAWQSTACPLDCGFAFAPDTSSIALALPFSGVAFWLSETATRTCYAATHVALAFEAYRFQRPPPRD